jgi:NitT/TauT family transport system permease protein
MTATAAQDLAGQPAKTRRFRSVLDPLLFLGGFLVIWEAVVRVTGIHSVILPSPGDVIEILVTRFPILVRSMGQTMVTVLAGFALGGLLGVAAGLAASRSERVRRAVYPFLVGLYVVPKAVLIPLMLLWWGVDFRYKLVVTVLLVFFPVTENTMRGLDGVDREMIELSRSLRTGEWFVFRKVRLPFILPYVLAGLRIGLTEAFIGAVLAEVLAPSAGIGSRIVEAGVFSNTAFILAGITVIAVTGLATYFLLVLVEDRLTRWY